MMFGKFYGKVLIGLLAGCLGSTVNAAVPGPYFFDWNTRNYSGVYGWPNYTPIPHAGHDVAADSSDYVSLYSSLDSLGRPLGLMLQPDTNPYDGTKDPNALTTVMSYVPRLDFVFADFEEDDRTHQNAQTQAMINQVRAGANPNINQAFIGNYNDFPGATDTSAVWPNQMDRSAASSFYLSSGLNVAMPGIYPYEYYANHVNGAAWGGDISPNKRSALFWAPLEKYSLAKRNLPAGHLLIPWTARFIDIKDSEGYFAPTPPREDVIAMIQHIRLRGADGYYRLGSIVSNDPSFVPSPSEEAQDRIDMYNAWHSLDSVFTGGTVTILNLDTDKIGGLEWSGVQVGNQVAILISNLSSTTQRITLPDIEGLPEYSDYVDSNQHLLKIYAVPEPGTMAVLAAAAAGGLCLRPRKHRRSMPLINNANRKKSGIINYDQAEPISDGLAERS